MSNPETLCVVPASVTQLGSTLQSSADRFAGTASTFDSAMHALVAASKGDSAVEIGRVATEWSRVYEQIKTALNDLGLRTEEAGEIYDEGRTEQASQVQSRTAEMNFYPTQA